MLSTIKKFAVCAIFAAALFSAGSLSAAQENDSEAKQADAEYYNRAADESCWKKFSNGVIWYLPNRLSDLLDIFTVELKAGEVALDLKLTRYATFGGAVGRQYSFGWSIYDQRGAYWQRGWSVDFLNYRAEDIYRKTVFGYYKPLFKNTSGKVDIAGMCKEKSADPWAIGINASLLLGANIEIHPVELADFIAGILCVDFKDDDRREIHWFSDDL